MRQVVQVLITIVVTFIVSLFMFNPMAKHDAFPRDIPWFSLMGTDSPEYSKERLKDRWTIVYFGYTSCPDLCPNTLDTVKKTFDKLAKVGPHVKDLQFLFVSVDPERDSVEKIKAYLDFYDPSFKGATGAMPVLKELLGSVDSDNLVDRGNGENYTVYHPTNLYVFDPKARWAGKIAEPLGEDQIIDSLMKMVLAYN